MKKLVLGIAAAMFILSCNSNPSATGDSIIMEHEKKTNALEWQQAPTDTMPQHTTAAPDTTAISDSVNQK